MILLSTRAGRRALALDTALEIRRAAVNTRVRRHSAAVEAFGGEVAARNVVMNARNAETVTYEAACAGQAAGGAAGGAPPPPGRRRGGEVRRALLLAAGLLAGTAGCAPRPAPASALWESITLAQARGLVAEAGGTIDEVGKTDEGGWHIEATFPGAMPMEFDGLSCKGEGEAQACPEYRLLVGLKAADEAEARALAVERDVNWIADGHHGDTYEIWRMGFLYGGVTREHLKNTLKVMLDVAWSSHDEMRDRAEKAKGRSR